MQEKIGDNLKRMLGMPVPPRHRAFQQPAASEAAPHLLTATMGDGLKALIRSVGDKEDKK